MSVFGTPVAVGNSNYPVASITATISTNVGDLIVVFMANLFGISGTCTCSDSAGNTYTVVTALDIGGNPAGNWFYCLSATHASASNVVTVGTSSSSLLLAMYAWDIPISGGNPPTLDFITPAAGGTGYIQGPSPGSLTIAPTGSDELILVTAADTSRTSTFSAGGSFTLESPVAGPYPGGLGGQHLVSSTPPTTAGMSWTGGTSNYLASIGFKASGPTPPPVPPVTHANFATFGKIVVPSAGTPVQVFPLTLNANTAFFSTLSGQSGQQMYIGAKGMNKSTLAGVMKVLEKPLATPPTLDSWAVFHSTAGAGVDLSSFWIDADTNNDGLLVSYLV